MFAFDRTDVQRFAISSIGALVVSTACLVAATAPVKAAEPADPITLSGWQKSVEKQIDANLEAPLGMREGDMVAVHVVVNFDDQGRFKDARIGQPSGSGAADRETLRVARCIRYPAMPAVLRGKPQAIGMEVLFGTTGSEQEVHKASSALREQMVRRAADIDASAQAYRLAALPGG